MDAFCPVSSFSREKSWFAASSTDLTTSIASSLEVLYKAAETKAEDPVQVLEALESLEKSMRAKAKDDPNVAKDVLQNLNGSWRLVFTTGTKNTQEKYGKINYFPIKAVQSFYVQQDPMRIENGIYVGDFCLIQFAGNFEFDMIKRRLEFDFSEIRLFNRALTLPLKQGEAAQLGAKSGLGSQSNVENSSRGRKAFFNWISADSKIATARGGGGGLALWKRVKE